jgi:LemA protein
MEYNTRIESFPDNVFAGMFAFRHAELYQVESAAEKAPVKVSF